MQIIPVCRSLLLAFMVPGSSTHLCRCPQDGSRRCASFLYRQSQAGVRLCSGKIQTGAEGEMRKQKEAPLSCCWRNDIVILSVRRNSCFGC